MARDAESHCKRLALEYRAIGELKPHIRNPRTHSAHQIDQIAASIREFGFTNPILTDANNGVIAGHGRLLAAKKLGLAEVPTRRIEHLSEAQIRAYVIADNKLAANAGWDEELLSLELQYIAELDLNFELEITGFETAEIDILLGATMENDDPDDEIPVLEPDRPTISRAGDLWLLGQHRLLCADATKRDSFTILMDGALAQTVFIDPPYNLPIQGHVSGLGAVKHTEFAMAAGEMSPKQFRKFLQSIFKHLGAHSIDGSIHYVCMDWRHVEPLLRAARKVYSEFKNLCVWNKTNGGMGSLYRSKHELVFVFKQGTAPHINNIALGEHGRYRTNVWDYAGVNTFGAERLNDLHDHPTVKPVALVADVLLDCSRRGGLVLDCFGGSGTTLLAAERTGRRACVMELEPKYVDISIERYQRITGTEVRHAGTRLTYETLARRIGSTRESCSRNSGDGK